jgi:hypothetical protein
MRALVKLPNPAALAAADSLPQELRKLASRYATGGIELTKLEAEEVAPFLRFMYELMAGMVKYLAPEGSRAWEDYRTGGDDPADEGWEAVSLTGPALRELDVDQADLDALGAIAGRLKTLNEITFASRRDRGLIADGETVPEKEGETVPGFAAFRGQPGSPERGPDSEDVRPAAVGAARDRRSRRGVRGRRGARD